MLPRRSPVQVDVWVYQTMDFRTTLSRCVYGGSPSFEGLRDEVVPKWLAGFERALPGDGFCAGSLSIADFMLVEALMHARAILAAKAGVADALSPYPRVSALVKRFETLPRVAEYLSSPTVKALPWNGPSARFR